MEEVENKNRELKETVQQLNDEMVNLKAEHKKICQKLECKEARLVLGQVAWLLEAEIWKAVLPLPNKTSFFNSYAGFTPLPKHSQRYILL